MAASLPLCQADEDCVILFARTPVPGRVKTRLCSRLTPEQACHLHWACVQDTAALLNDSLPLIPKWLFLSEEPHPEISVPGFRNGVQQGTDLGERLADAFGRAFASGAGRVVIFGSDSPTLPSAIPRQSLEALAKSDLVLGPSEDGGYYLIGSRRFDPQLFRQVEWSTTRTFQQTLANAQRLAYSIAVLEPWFDVDEWKDVERLAAAAAQGEALPENLAAFLRQLGADA
ncbi:MAG: TIGR04282 family arsenosugar biosynthesis glycosyltransferase [Acidobacteria bacterium]|nr:TIGR04282 family arsenosugar biosynthesis glycosyltransferase [Acidobacteriota bacterium]